MLRSLNSCRTLVPTYNYSVYFLRGTDGRTLNMPQQQ